MGSAQENSSFLSEIEKKIPEENFLKQLCLILIEAADSTEGEKFDNQRKLLRLIESEKLSNNQAILNNLNDLLKNLPIHLEDILNFLENNNLLQLELIVNLLEHDEKRNKENLSKRIQKGMCFLGFE